MSKWITVQKAAPLLDMTDDQVYRSIREGKFPFRIIRIGKLIRISASDIGLVDQSGAQNEEAQDKDQSLATAA
jgi:excisionase family DNA binding protein